MAILYVTEYENMCSIPNNPAQMPVEPALAEQQLAISGASVASVAFNLKTRFVRLNVDSSGPCCHTFGVAPVATTAFGRLSPNQTEYKGVPEGRAFKVAVISVAL